MLTPANVRETVLSIEKTAKSLNEQLVQSDDKNVDLLEAENSPTLSLNFNILVTYTVSSMSDR